MEYFVYVSDAKLDMLAGVGTVAQPRSWFAGTAALAWGTVGTQGEVAYFTNVVDGTLLGLTGSSEHPAGLPDDLVRGHRSGALRTGRVLGPGHGGDRMGPEPGHHGARRRGRGRFAQGDAAAVATMLGIHRRLYGRAEPLRYLAKRLIELPASAVNLSSGVHSPGSENTPVFDRILLGTPLYVAMAD